MPASGTTSEPSAWFARGLTRRLLVIAICSAVTLATAVAVQRSGAPGPGAAAARDSGIQRSSTRIPPAGSSRTPAVHSSSPAGEDGTAGGQVPAEPSDALHDLLADRSSALRAGDRDAWMAGLAPASDARVKSFRVAQERVFDRVRTLRPVSWSYQVAGGFALPAERRAALGGVAWLADVQLDYQLTAGGPVVHRQQFLTVVGRPGDWLIADDTDGSTGRDVWDFGPITHAASSRCLVVGARGRRAQVEQLAAECGSAARTVDAAWGRSWSRRTLLTVPDTLPQLAVLLGRSGSAGPGAPVEDVVDTAGLERTAAVTIGPSDGAADGVLINAAAFDELSAVGRRVVLTHELVHVATRATGARSAPTWLAEGYADHVAYAGTGLSAQQVAGDALDAVRAGRMPSALPAADAFNAAGDEAAAAYGQSWAAAGLIAAKAGTAARMKAFYEQAAAPGAGPAALDTALAALGLGGTTAFVELWQARLDTLSQ